MPTRSPEASMPGHETDGAALSELEGLLRRTDASSPRLGIRDAERLARLYVRAAAELQRARREEIDPARLLALEGVLASAYSMLYARGPQRPSWPRVLTFLIRDFPRLVRSELRLIGLSAALLLAGALAGAFVVHFDPGALLVVVPDMHLEQTPDERVRHEAQREAFDAGGSAVFSSFLFTHNIQVTFLVFALGLTCGIGSAAVLFWNGIPVGALAAQYHGSDQALFFWAWILPHGVVELSVVAIAGGAGFVLARGLVRPGRRSRRAALAFEARRALGLVLGGMPLLVIAGLVEGSVSQLHPPLVPLGFKLGVASVLALALFLYLRFGGFAASPKAPALNSRLPARAREAG